MNKVTPEYFLKKYGDIEVCFTEYYRYFFTFQAQLPDNQRLVIKCGGTSNISDMEVKNSIKLSTLFNNPLHSQLFYCGLYTNKTEIEYCYP